MPKTEETTTNSRRRAQEWPFPRHRHFSKELRQTAATWFKTKGFATHPRMPYCLAEWNDWESNIILKEVAAYVKERSAEAEQKGYPFPLHKYLHHGLSSQAMAFNLIGPMITRNDYSPLIQILNERKVPGAETITEARFEYEDRKVFNEDTGQPTSIDIVLKDVQGHPRVFIESKLDEQEFGGCSVFEDGDCSGKNPVGDEDSCFLHFIGRRYWERMAEHGITETVQSDRQCIFAGHYQFFREVLLATNKGGTFVLLSDARSPVFRCRAGEKEKGLMPFLTGLLPKHLRERVVSINTQDLVRSIEGHREHQDWIIEFKAKYGIGDPQSQTVIGPS